MQKLADPALPDDERERLAEDFRANNAQRKTLQTVFAERVGRHPIPESAGWFLTDALGNQIARSPEMPIIGHNYSWRSYFSGLPDDQPQTWRPRAGEHITGPHLSAVYRGQATHRWILAVSAPVYDLSSEPKFLGVAGLIIEIGEFVDFEGENPHQYATLVDYRDGKNKGLVLQHPRLKKLLDERADISEEELRSFRVNLHNAPDRPGRLVDYVDPLSEIPLPQQDWLAEAAPVQMVDAPASQNNCLMVVVQESHRGEIGATLAELKGKLLYYGAMALAVIAVVMIGLWTLAIRMFGKGVATRLAPPGEIATDSSGGVTPDSTDSGRQGVASR